MLQTLGILWVVLAVIISFGMSAFDGDKSGSASQGAAVSNGRMQKESPVQRPKASSNGVAETQLEIAGSGPSSVRTSVTIVPR